MSLITSHPRKKNDFYPTPELAVIPLLPHLPERATFHEPCAGAADLVNHLESHGVRCVAQTDISPRASTVVRASANDLTSCKGDMFITNPPYLWKHLSVIMPHLYTMAPTWLLLPAAMMHNQRMSGHMKRCIRIVSVGRVQWFKGSGAGTLDYAWYLFDARRSGPAEFYGRNGAV